jgi:hypothetical protein
MTHPRFATVTRLPQSRTIFSAVPPPGIVLALVWLITDVTPWGDMLVPPLEARFPASDLGEPQTIAGVVDSRSVITCNQGYT